MYRRCGPTAIPLGVGPVRVAADLAMLKQSLEDEIKFSTKSKAEAQQSMAKSGEEMRRQSVAYSGVSFLSTTIISKSRTQPSIETLFAHRHSAATLYC